MNNEEFGSLNFLNWNREGRGDQRIQPFCRICSTQEIRSPLFYLNKFQKIGKNAGESCRAYWNLMNDKEFESLKFVELKYRRGEQIIQLFSRMGSPKEIWVPVFNLREFQKIDKSTS